MRNLSVWGKAVVLAALLVACALMLPNAAKAADPIRVGTSWR